MKERGFKEGAVLSLLVLFSFAIRCWNIGSASFWINEADHSRILLLHTLRDKFAYSSSSAGLYIFDIIYTNAFLFLLPDEYISGNEGALRLPSAVACSISIPIVYKLSTRFCEYKMAWLLTIAWALNPFAIEWGRQFFTYTNMPIWSTLLLIATFRLTSSIKSHNTTNLDWIFFHLMMIICITSNLFIILVVCALFPHLVCSIVLNREENKDRIRLLVSAYGPHLFPGIIIVIQSLRNGLDPSKNDNSWMPSATWNTPFETLEMVFPEPTQIGALAIVSLVSIRLVQRIRFASKISVISLLQREETALFFAGTLQLFCFLGLQLLGSPSWVTRYMLHLIPMWLVLIGAWIAPIGYREQQKSFLGRRLPTIGQVGTGVVFLIVISTGISIGPAPDMRGEDVRGAWEVVADDYEASESQVFLTHPTDYFYVYYIEMLELEPDELVGSWQDIPEEKIDEIIAGNPDSVHRVRLASHDDSALGNMLNEYYNLENSSEPRGMVVEHWVRK